MLTDGSAEGRFDHATGGDSACRAAAVMLASQTRSSRLRRSSPGVPPAPLTRRRVESKLVKRRIFC
jgi:hypothetical protein